MALIPIKTASETGYCDCICGCYELASLRDEDTGKAYCPSCAKDHLELNAGAGIPQPAPLNYTTKSPTTRQSAPLPSPAPPPPPLLRSPRRNKPTCQRLHASGDLRSFPLRDFCPLDQPEIEVREAGPTEGIPSGR